MEGPRGLFFWLNSCQNSPKTRLKFIKITLKVNTEYVFQRGATKFDKIKHIKINSKQLKKTQEITKISNKIYKKKFKKISKISTKHLHMFWTGRFYGCSKEGYRSCLNHLNGKDLVYSTRRPIKPFP